MFDEPLLGDELLQRFDEGIRIAHGFTGGLNYYRSMDLKWRQRKAWEGVPSAVPAFFSGSEYDCDLEGFHGPDPIALMRAQFPDLRAVEMIPGAGHMVQREKPAAVNRHLLRFPESLR